jgi:D-alanyl-D-alanine dipeptidase
MAKSVSDPPIRVFHDGKYWRVDYGSYMDGFHATRAEATAKASAAAAHEHRELEIEAMD